MGFEMRHNDPLLRRNGLLILIQCHAQLNKLYSLLPKDFQPDNNSDIQET